MKLLKYEDYNITIEPELLTLKPFKQIWDRDKSNSKNKAISEIAYIYFFCDPKSDYQYIVDPEERKKAIKEGEGLPDKWEPDKIVTVAMQFYESFKPEAALLLEDTRFMVDKFRRKIREVDFETLEVKELKDIGALIKQIPLLVKNLDEAEKAIIRETTEMGKMRGQGEKTIFEDSLNI